MSWCKDQYKKWPWYIKAYYHLYYVWYGLNLEVGQVRAWYRRKTNTHAKWCCKIQFNGPCCCHHMEYPNRQNQATRTRGKKL